ncbi:hypothetical protein EJB05_05736 [Eragrostis curvula]|uniref:Uncharacterized protein n=1 Tax=Eragrostis curvula TaxID=38414 RepID=A0A5J9WE48_9POAL|nr:hypothetical protein EJB05_05736 [Eragrostis curvula]
MDGHGEVPAPRPAPDPALPAAKRARGATGTAVRRLGLAPPRPNPAASGSSRPNPEAGDASMGDEEAAWVRKGQKRPPQHPTSKKKNTTKTTTARVPSVEVDPSSPGNMESPPLTSPVAPNVPSSSSPASPAGCAQQVLDEMPISLSRLRT